MAALFGCGGGDEIASTDGGKSGTSGASKPTFIPPTAIPADAATRGMWSPVYPWPLVSVHTTLLPDGRVLTYGSDTAGVQTGRNAYDIWDSFGSPGAGHLTLDNTSGTDIFCSASILIAPENVTASPSVFIAGGDIWTGTRTLNDGNNNSNILNVTTNSLTRGNAMQRARWYPTATTLVNGETYLQGGRPGGDRPEVRRRDGTFRLLSNVNTEWLDTYYPRNFVGPDGRIFGYDVNGNSYFVDPGANGGTGSMTPAFSLPRIPTDVSSDTASSVMFRTGRILQIGGNSNAAQIIDINSGTPVISYTNSLSTRRQYVVTTILPDGKVLATGGSSVKNENIGTNNSAEIWNPATGQWLQGPSGVSPRLYHGNALLLPDGAVLVTGGGAGSPVNNLNSEVYYPPYLFSGTQRAVRPEVTTAPDWLEIGQTFTVQVASTTAISRVTLVKTGSATHGLNMEQRFLELPFNQAGSTLKVQGPTRAAEATPGYYHLFVFNQAGVPSVSHIFRMGIAANPNPAVVPVLGNPGARSGVVGTAQSVQLSATDPNGDALTYNAAGLPPGLSIAGATGLISGSPTTAGSYNVVASVTDGINSASANFVWSITQPVGLVLAPLPTPVAVLANGAVSFTASATGVNPLYRWDFGDGTQTAYSPSAAATHTYTAPGTYSVTVTVTDDSDTVISRSFLQTVYLPATAARPAASTNLLLETPATGNPRLWVVNQDNDSVSVFDAVTRAKLAEVNVGTAPRSIARASDGSMWVTNKLSASLTVIDPNSRAVLATVAMPRASQPFGIAVSPTAAQAFVTLEATGQLLKIDTQTRTVIGQVGVGSNPRQVSITADGANAYVSRFITPPLPGEATANVSTPATVGGEIVVVATGSLAIQRTVILRHGDKSDQENQGRGIPNYLGAAVISPDGTQAWVPSKQDNIKRGTLRDGAALNFQSTVRAISSRIVLATGEEDVAARVDHDNASLASAAAYDSRGVYLFVALETSREVAVVGAHGGGQILRINVGRAPQGLAVSNDGKTLYVSNFMDRTVGVYDLRPLVDNGQASAPLLATLTSVATERLTPTVLLGKQLFYDARDTRLSRDSYMSCASCHNDGGHDGRVWDFTGQGEGLRNTIALRGRAGMGQGRLHWSANFDEVQDFEGQIRMLAGGSGLMSDAAYLAGTRSQPLGTTKAGQSADLDALASYVGSLNSFAPSPNRAANGALSAAATAGRAVFTTQGCASCHGGTAFSGSGSVAPANIGTIKPSSGQTLGAALAGIDIPTLRDVWSTAPYLHDGSAASVEAAVRAHNTVTTAGLPDADLASLGAYLREVGSEETLAPGSPVGGLSATVSASSAAVNLSTEGPADWTHWGDGVPGLVRKAGVTAQISAYTLVGAGAATAYVDDLRPMTWTGGAPTAAATNRLTGLYKPGVNTGFSITVPADTTQRTVKLYVGGWNSSGRLLAELSDGSAASYTETTAASAGQYNRTYTLTYNATSAGQQLRLTWTMAAGGGNVTLNGAALSVAQANQPPVLTTPAAQTTTVNQPVTLAVSATDPNGDTLSYSVTGLPPGLSIAAATGAISGTPTTVGTYTPNVVVQDGRGGNVNASFSWTVQAAVNRPPVLTMPGAQTTTVNQAVNFAVQASDPDADVLSYSATGLPPGLTISPTTGAITGTATTIGTYTPNVVVQDGLDGTANASFSWTVQAAANRPPVLTTPGAQTTTVNQTVSLAVQASDPDADVLSYSATGLPPGLVISPTTGAITGTATTIGTYTPNVVVQDGLDGTANASFSWTVQAAANRPPVLTTPGAQTTTVNQAVSLAVQASDPDADVLSYSATGLPPGLVISPTTGAISGTVTTVGTYTPNVVVQDGRGGTVNGSFAWTVQAVVPVNRPPVLTAPAAQTTPVNQPVTLAVQATDPDGDSLSFSATGLPGGLSIAPATGVISGTPTIAGSFTVNLAVQDSQAAGATASFAWTVEAAIPVGGSLSGAVSAAATAANLATEGTADWTHWGDGVPGLVRKAGVTAQISAYTLVGPAGATAYGDDLRPLSWTGGTPTAAATNRTTGLYVSGLNNGYTLTVPADTTERTVKLYVGGWNSSGRLVAQLSDGSAANYTDTTVAAAGQYTRAYTIAYRAAAAGQTLRLTWTQANATGGNVTLNGASLAGAVAANQPPVITTPAAQTTQAGVATTLAVVASDPNGDTLSYSATGLPPGLAISASAGVISGTATTAGNYSPNVVVQDGRGGSANASFSWTVQVAAPVNRPPVLTTPAAQTTTVNQAVNLGVVASDPDGDALTFSASGLPAGLAIAGPTGVISGAPTTAGSYTVGLAVQDSKGATVTGSFTWTVQAAVPVGGSLTGAVSTAVTAANLTTEGTLDWTHWGDGVPGLVRKAGVTAQISAYTIVGAGAPLAYGNDLRPLTWTGGAPTAAATNRTTGLYIPGQNNGFTLTVPADTTSRTVKLYVGGWNSSGRLVAQLSDGSAANYTNTTVQAAGQYSRTYTITYRAGSAGQQLRLTWTHANATGGNVTLNGAALR